MLAGGRSRAEMQKETGVNAYYLEREYIPQARNFKPERLNAALGMVADADLELRSAKYDKRTVVERLFMRLCV
jgi:DNA polymerase III delta subunit